MWALYPQLADTAGALDFALWFVGKWGCSYCEEKGYAPIADFCRQYCMLRSRDGGVNLDSNPADGAEAVLQAPPNNGPAHQGAATNDNNDNTRQLNDHSAKPGGADEDGAEGLSDVHREHWDVATALNINSLDSGSHSEISGNDIARCSQNVPSARSCRGDMQNHQRLWMPIGPSFLRGSTAGVVLAIGLPVVLTGCVELGELQLPSGFDAVS